MVANACLDLRSGWASIPCRIFSIARTFRNWLAAEGAEREIFDDLAARLQAEGLMMREGPVVDATFVESPSSTKNRDHARDPEAHQAKKGNNWHFGHKAHAGADRDGGLVHTAVATAANVADVVEAKGCVRECDEEVYLDAGYTGLERGSPSRSRSGRGGASPKTWPRGPAARGRHPEIGLRPGRKDGRPGGPP